MNPDLAAVLVLFAAFAQECSEAPPAPAEQHTDHDCGCSRVYFCPACEALCGQCFGAHDDMPAVCDACFVRYDAA